MTTSELQDLKDDFKQMNNYDVGDEFYFGFEDLHGDFFFWTTPKSVWDREGHMYDQHGDFWGLEALGFYDVMESCWEYDGSPQDGVTAMLNVPGAIFDPQIQNGFQQDPNFDPKPYINGTAGSTPTPTTTSPTSPTSPTIPTTAGATSSPMSMEEKMESAGIPVDYDPSMDEELPEDTNARGLSSGFSVSLDTGVADEYTYDEPEISDEEEVAGVEKALQGASSSALDSVDDFLNNITEEDETNSKIDDILGDLDLLEPGVECQDTGVDVTFDIDVDISDIERLQKQLDEVNGTSSTPQPTSFKNILFINSSHDGATTAFISDLSKLDVTIPDQKDALDAIEASLNGQHGEFGQFSVSNLGIFDNGGYLLINTLHDVYGFPKGSFTVDNQVFCCSDV